MVKSEEELTLQIYEKGHIILNSTIKRNSPEFEALVDWASINNDGWAISVPNYVPSILVQGRNLQLNLTPHRAILGIGRQQYEKIISLEDYEELKKELLPDKISAP